LAVRGQVHRSTVTTQQRTGDEKQRVGEERVGELEKERERVRQSNTKREATVRMTDVALSDEDLQLLTDTLGLVNEMDPHGSAQANPADRSAWSETSETMDTEGDAVLAAESSTPVTTQENTTEADAAGAPANAEEAAEIRDAEWLADDDSGETQEVERHTAVVEKVTAEEAANMEPSAAVAAVETAVTPPAAVQEGETAKEPETPPDAESSAAVAESGVTNAADEEAAVSESSASTTAGRKRGQHQETDESEAKVHEEEAPKVGLRRFATMPRVRHVSRFPAPPATAEEDEGDDVAKESDATESKSDETGREAATEEVPKVQEQEAPKAGLRRFATMPRVRHVSRFPAPAAAVEEDDSAEKEDNSGEEDTDSQEKGDVNGEAANAKGKDQLEDTTEKEANTQGQEAPKAGLRRFATMPRVRHVSRFPAPAAAAEEHVGEAKENECGEAQDAEKEGQEESSSETEANEVSEPEQEAPKAGLRRFASMPRMRHVSRFPAPAAAVEEDDGEAKDGQSDEVELAEVTPDDADEGAGDSVDSDTRRSTSSAAQDGEKGTSQQPVTPAPVARQRSWRSRVVPYQPKSAANQQLLASARDAASTSTTASTTGDEAAAPTHASTADARVVADLRLEVSSLRKKLAKEEAAVKQADKQMMETSDMMRVLQSSVSKNQYECMARIQQANTHTRSLQAELTVGGSGSV
jgi:hypothetical protein